MITNLILVFDPLTTQPKKRYLKKDKHMHCLYFISRREKKIEFDGKVKF